MHEGSLALSAFFKTVFCSVEVCMKIFRIEYPGSPTTTSLTCTYKPRLQPLMTRALSLFSHYILYPYSDIILFFSSCDHQCTGILYKTYFHCKILQLISVCVRACMQTTHTIAQICRLYNQFVDVIYLLPPGIKLNYLGLATELIHKP